MDGQLGGFPFWTVSFDEQGADPAPLAAELGGQGVTDLFVLAHGWNSDRAMALALYRDFFEALRGALDQGGLSPEGIGVAGALWPSMRWADEAAPAGVAAARAAPRDDGALVRQLQAVYHAPAERQALDELAQLLATRPADPAALLRFQQLMAPLTGHPDAAAAAEDDGESGLLTVPPEQVYETLAGALPSRRRAAEAAFANPFGRWWDGAKEALRQATYWQMKKRAGTVGQQGLGPLLARLRQDQPALRCHLIGHSFGARLVSFAAAAQPPGSSPVRSVLLLQGAFSHFAFAPALPWDRSRAGALGGTPARVGGPLLVSHSLHDLAVGQLYPLASSLARDDASILGNLLFRWGAMGHDGAQAVGAAAATLGPVGQRYQFPAGAVTNLDANAVIAKGGPPAGAHSDIVHPELGWAVLAAAGRAVR